MKEKVKQRLEKAMQELEKAKNKKQAFKKKIVKLQQEKDEMTEMEYRIALVEALNGQTVEDWNNYYNRQIHEITKQIQDYRAILSHVESQTDRISGDHSAARIFYATAFIILLFIAVISINNYVQTPTSYAIYAKDQLPVNTTNLTAELDVTYTKPAPTLHIISAFSNEEHGAIQFEERPAVRDLNQLEKKVVVENNYIWLDSESTPELNRPAQLSFYNLPYKKMPVIYRNNEPCPSEICRNIEYNPATGQLDFTVTRFTSYTTGSNSFLLINDTTDFTRRGTGELVTFYANYSNITSEDDITTANCNITISGTTYNMVLDGATNLFYYNRTFSTAGPYAYTVQCWEADYEALSTTDSAYITQAVSYKESAWATSEVGDATNIANVEGAPDLTYATYGKNDYIYTTGYDTTGMYGNITQVEAVVIYYGPVSANRDIRTYYDESGSGNPIVEAANSPISEGGDAANPLTDIWDITSIQTWEWADIDNFYYEVYNDDPAAPDALGVDAIFLNITYKNYLPTIYEEGAAFNQTLVKEGGAVRLYNVTVVDDYNTGTVRFDVAGTNYTANNYTTNEWQFELNCTVSGTYSWKNVYANDTFNHQYWANKTVNKAWSCDVDNPNMPSIGVQGFSEDDWLNGSSVTIECNESGDVGPAGINSTSYLYEYNSTDTGGFVNLCSDNGTTCNWTLPADTYNITVRCLVQDNLDHNSSWATIHFEGIDNTGPNTTIDLPVNWTNISTNTYVVNASITDYAGIGVDMAWFDYRENDTASWSSICVKDSSPYNCSWNLAALPDNDQYQVRARANDSINNLGAYDYIINITVDRQGPTSNLVTPISNENISVNETAVSATVSDEFGTIDTVTFEYRKGAVGGWTFACDDNRGPVYDCTWNLTTEPDGNDYQFRVWANDTVGNVGNYDTHTSIVVDRTGPDIYLERPATNTWNDATAVFEFNVTDALSEVRNCSLMLDQDTNYTLNWLQESTTHQIQYNFTNNNYTWAMNCTDALGTWNDTETRTIWIDTDKPYLDDPYINQTVFDIADSICLNITAFDNVSGLDKVWATIKYPGGTTTKIMVDDGSGCDITAGDHVYSYKYNLQISGNYNWTSARANDTVNNINLSSIGLNWTVLYGGNLIINMTSPTTDFEINESDGNNQFAINCFVQCNSTGGCTNSTMVPQYNPEEWTDVTDNTSDLINEVPYYACGDQNENDTCSITFNITSGSNSGNNNWELRCKATSNNLGIFFSEQSVNVTINDHPTAALFYPPNNTWLSGIETLNASTSSDSDGSVSYYSFEIDNNLAFSSASVIYSGPANNTQFNTSDQNQCTEHYMSCYLRLNVTDDDGLNASLIYTFGIDNTGPNTTIVLPANWTNTSSNSLFMNATFADDGIGTISSVIFAYRINNQASWTDVCTDSDGSPYNCTLDLSALPDSRDYQINAYSIDSLGNVGQNDTTANITVDRTVPTIELNTPIDDFNTSDTSLVLNFTPTDNIAPTLNCSLYVNGDLNNTNLTASNNTLTGFTVNNLIEAAQTWNVTCNDYLSNSNYSMTRTITVDQTPPTITLNSPTNGSIIQAGTTIDLTITDARGISSKWWSIDNGVTNSTSFTGDADIDTSSWNSGPTTLYVWANDSVNNLAEAMFYFKVDADAPLISLYEPAADYKTNMSWIVFNFSAEENMYNYSNCSIYLNGVYNTSNATSYNNTFTQINITGLNESLYNWTINCTDNALNSNISDQRSFTIDWTPPNVTNIQPSSYQPYDPNSNVLIRATVKDNVLVDTVLANISWNSGKTTMTLTDPNKDNIYTGIFSNTATIGNYTIRIIANDTLGHVNNTEEANFTVRVPLTNMGTPTYANVTDDPAATADNNDASKNVTSQTSVKEGTCNLANCADADTLEASGNTAQLEVNWTNSVPGGSNITDSELTLTWDYDALDKTPEANSVTADFYWYNNSQWNAITACQNVIVPTSPAQYTCSLQNYIATVDEANHVTIQIRISQSGSGQPSEARTWMNIVNLTVGYYDIQRPNVTAVNVTPRIANLTNTLNISANVTDNYNLDYVTARVSYPNGTIIDYNLSQHGIVWDYSFTDTVVKGIHNITILAYDVSNLVNDSETYSFTINDVTRPTVALNFPDNDYSTDAGVTVNFNWSATDNYESSVTCNLTVNDTVYNDITSSTSNWTNYTVYNFNYGYYHWNLTCWDISNNTNTSHTRNFTILNPYNKQLNITVFNETYTISSITTIEITNQSGVLWYSGTGTGLVTLDINQSYDVKIWINFSNQLKATIYNLSISDNINLTIEGVENYTYSLPNNVTNLTSLFAMDDDSISYNYTTLEIPINNIDLNVIVHCTNFNFVTGQCLAWEVNNTGDYDSLINSTHLVINVTEFDTFGGGAGNTLPNITAILIYNVTGLGDPNTGGTLLQSGLNTTFNLYAHEMYRIEFVIRNDGNNWVITANDVVQQSGLNDTWNISENNIRYNDSDSIYYTNGGNFTNGVVAWNLSSGGKIKANQIGHFWYVVNITSIDDDNYPVRFLINDTSKSSGSTDSSVYSITGIDNVGPYVELTSPDNDSYFNYSTITFYFNVSDERSDIENCSLILNGTINETKDGALITEDVINSITATNMHDGQFLWTVNCTDTRGNEAASINNRTIVIDTTPPSALSLVSPANNTITTNTTPWLSWQQPTENYFAYYHIQIASDQDFTSITQTTYTYNLTNTSIEVSLNPNSINYWHVMAFDKAENNYTAAYHNYTTDNIAPSVTLINPTFNDTDPDGNVTFTFNVFDSNVRNCSLYTNLTGAWLPNTTIDVTNGLNSFNIRDLAQGTQFYWNVECFDHANTSAFAPLNHTVLIGPPEDYYQNITILTNLTINNTPPLVLTVSVASPINLETGITKEVNCSAEAFDDNGQADILYVNATLYHSTSDDGNPDNNNTHYTTACSCNVEDASTKNCTCTFDMYYFANNGTWTCNVTAMDEANDTNSLSENFLVNSLYALEVRPNVINYGQLTTWEISEDQNATIINLGNMIMDLTTYGFANDIDDGAVFDCPYGNITATYERYDLVNQTAFAAMTPISDNSAAPNNIDFNLAKQDDYVINKTDEIYWKVQVPPLTLGECNGTITFGAKEDT